MKEKELDNKELLALLVATYVCPDCGAGCEDILLNRFGWQNASVEIVDGVLYEDEGDWEEDSRQYECGQCGHYLGEDLVDVARELQDHEEGNANEASMD